MYPLNNNFQIYNFFFPTICYSEIWYTMIDPIQNWIALQRDGDLQHGFQIMWSHERGDFT